MAWAIPIDWLSKAVRYKVTRADMQTISDSLVELGIGAGLYTNAPGWIDSPNPWTYDTGFSFRVIGVDVRARYQLGAKLSCTDAGVTKYAYSGGAIMAGSDTLISWLGGYDYTLSGGAITNPRYSYAASAQDFPGFFNHTPSYGGWAATPTITCWFSINGRVLTYSFFFDGTSNSTAANLDLPFTAAATAYVPLTRVYDNGAKNTDTTNFAKATLGSATLQFAKADSVTGWTNANEKLVAGQVSLPF